MIRILFVICSLQFICLKSYSQERKLIGRVVSGKAMLSVENANVAVYKDTIFIFNTITDSLGRFYIPSNIYLKGNYIQINALGYSLLKSDIDKRKEDLDDLGQFSIIPEQNILKEVIIKGTKRYSDTTHIDFTDKKFERSVMVNDLFEENGFHKDSKGQLYYKGKAVSNLVVNGQDFFGKNNLDVYDLLPALAIKEMEVVETSVDSVSNITLLRPTIKVNLTLKDKYAKGKFGNSNLGFGTEHRYLGTADLYTYKKKEQASLTVNTNNINIGDNPSSDPLINFSAFSNNLVVKTTRFTYSNAIAKNMILNFSVKGKIENTNYISESERKDEIINQFSKTINTSKSKSIGFSDAKLRINYNIDNLTTLSITQTNDYNRKNITDSLNYMFKTDTSNTASNLSRLQTVINQSALTEVIFKHRFSSKIGRLLNIGINRQVLTNTNKEFDNIYNLSNNITSFYFINGIKTLQNSIYSFATDFTEPINNSAYINFFLAYKKENIKYDSDGVSDSLLITNSSAKISNQYFRAGLSFQKNFQKVSVNGMVSGLYNLRNSVASNQFIKTDFVNPNLSLAIDYKINDKKSLSVNYKTIITYPELNQLFNITSSFDLISEQGNNLNLKPETKNSFTIAYDIKKSNSESLSVTGGVDYYFSKFGLAITTLPDAPQSTFVENIGSSISSTVGLSFVKNITDKLIVNYYSTFSYLQQPTIINSKLNQNSGITFTQTLSTSKEIFKDLLSFSPTFTFTYSKYNYEFSSPNIINLIYTDKITFSLSQFILDLYPLFNYNHSFNNLSSFSLNAGVKKTIFKKYGTVWIQGYDLLNSFKFNNTFLGSSYSQTINYSNLKRYFILGLSFKFNNLK